jgi:hypothetical protein
MQLQKKFVQGCGKNLKIAKISKFSKKGKNVFGNQK